MTRLTSAIAVVCLAVPASAEENALPPAPPAVEPGSSSALPLFMRVRQRDAALSRFEEAAKINRSTTHARERVARILGDASLPPLNIKVPAETEPAYFRWERAPETESESAMRIIVVVTRKRIADTRELTADFTRLALELRMKGSVAAPVLREAVCGIVEEGGYENLTLGRLIADRGGPMSVTELAEHLERVLAEDATKEEKAAFAFRDELAQATLYMLGYDLHSRDLLRKFMAGELSAAELEKELDSEEAWARQRKPLAPPRRNRPMFPPPEIRLS